MLDLTQCISFSEHSFNGSLDPSITSRLSRLPPSSFSLLKASSSQSKRLASKRIAVCFSGGPAPGGHNVVLAIAKLCGSTHSLFGIMGGLGGLVKGHLKPLSIKDCLAYHNLGGFDLLKTDRTKLHQASQYKAIKDVVAHYQLDAIIIIGGDDSHTNAVFLAQELSDHACAIIGVPKTIDGDLRCPPYLPISFGFYSVCDLFISLINNLICDTRSSQKYWHFVKLMGRSSSHITHYVAQHTPVDLFFLGEKIAHNNTPLSAIIKQIADTILESSHNQKPYGVICIPEGLLEWVPEIRNLIQTLNTLRDASNRSPDLSHLSQSDHDLFLQFPEYIQHQLLLDCDSHGNIQLSRIETERLLIHMVTSYLSSSDPSLTLDAMPHFYGYEGRCTHPNAFDSEFCTKLGYIATSLALNGYTGHMAALDSITSPYQAYGVPIAHLLRFETRFNHEVPVVKKTIVTDF
ncbi:diphosphate--fructose-6-phosphate 1-phosphotransferase [bacterium]|nr:diphosphate--fructose-6-phosphate 1-phosphotransferase [bacterium]